MGRRAKPAAVDAAQGNPSRRKRVVAVRIPATGAIGEPPPELRPVQQAVWRRIAPELGAANFIRATDLDVVARYCEHLYDFWRLTEILRLEGDWYRVETNHGAWKRRHPAWDMRNQAEADCMALEDRLGLNPLARMKVLHLMNALVAAPTLPFDKPKTADEEGAAPPAADAEQPSAVGFLRSDAVH